jgi:hypothetical protein
MTLTSPVFLAAAVALFGCCLAAEPPAVPVEARSGPRRPSWRRHPDGTAAVGCMRAPLWVNGPARRTSGGILPIAARRPAAG